MINLGLKIKIRRETLGLSQKQLAEKANVAQSSIHYIETNQSSPTHTTLQKLAAALNVTLIELLG